MIEVLACLSKNQNKVVSKDELIKIVWKDRVVSDDSIVRCISVLRKHFKNNQVLGLKIETLAKKGYRLTVIDQSIDVQEKKEVIEPTSYNTMSPKRKNNRLFLSSLALVIVIILLASNLIIPEQAVDDPGYQRTVLLASAAKERYPELSIDGHWITFAKATDTGMAIFVKSLTDNGLQQITSGEFYDHQPTFSPDSRQIIFARVNSEQQCELRILSTIGGVDKKVGDCRKQGVYSMAWSHDGRSIYFIDKNNSIDQGQLNQLEVATSNQWVINLDNEMGIDDFALSHDGNKIAVSMSPLLGVEDIYVSHLGSKYDWRRLSNDASKIHGLAFSANDKSILFSSNRTGAFHLWKSALENWSPKIVNSAVPNISEISVNKQGVVAVERWTESSQISKIAVDGSVGLVIEDKGVNWGASRSPVNNDIVFVSNRTGHSELWLKSENSMHQLTFLNGPWLKNPSWSFDGKTIAFSITTPLGTEIRLYQVDTQKIESIKGFSMASSPFWDRERKQLYFSQMKSGNWQIWRWDSARDQITPMTSQGGKYAKLAVDGVFLFTKDKQKGLWRLNENGQEQLVVDELQAIDWNNWTVANNSIYYVSRLAHDGPTLIQQALDSNQKLAEYPLPGLLYFSGISVDRIDDSIWYSSLIREDADIDLLTGAKIK